MTRPCSPELGEWSHANSVMQVLRRHGPEVALEALTRIPSHLFLEGGMLLRELDLRLRKAPGPRLLVDGVWFSRPMGGITRVWEQILGCWALPGLVSDSAPVCILDRDSRLARVQSFETLSAEYYNPLDWSQFPFLASDNAKHVMSWGADVFLSSWISTCGESDQVTVPELVLVHDCIPERATLIHAEHKACRKLWLQRASALVAVSADTAHDLHGFCNRHTANIVWCHPSPASTFLDPLEHALTERLWQQLSQAAGLIPPYILLPATSSIGSYKNPELLALALQEPGLQSLQLVVTGLAASTHAHAFAQQWPLLAPRLVVAGLTDLQLAVAYRHALAVILPSRVEGFGLPAIEALATGATVILSDSRGLREAGGPACPRVNPDQPRELAAWLRMLLDRPSSDWLLPRLTHRRLKRMDSFNPDILGLALLAQARQLSDCL